MKSESEEFCKARFDTYLKKIVPGSTIIYWEEVEKKSDLIEKVDVGRKNNLPVSVIRDILADFVKDEVEVIARNGGYLRGTYLIKFSKPITNLADIKYSVQSVLLSFISNTQTACEARIKVIYKKGRQECSIEKLNRQQDKVFMGGPYISRREAEALVEAKALLNDRMAEKKYRLRNINYPKILLLHDKYPFADHDTYKTCISETSSLQFFHTIFIVGRYHEGEILFSQESTWMKSS